MDTGATYLVTGAMGCIGAWALYHLTRQGQRAVGFDLSANRARLDLLLSRAEQSEIVFVQGDLTDPRQVAEAVRAHGVTHIVHLAALQVPFCRANPVAGAQVNVVGTVNVFEAARHAGVKHLAHASSIAVYGAPSEYAPGLMLHDAPPNPHTLYGVYKVACEGIAHVYWQDHGIASVGLRPYVVYGAGRDQGLTSDPTKAVLAAAAGVPFHIGFGGVMQFQYASDVARQFIDAARAGLPGANTFNLGTRPASVAEFVASVQRLRPGAQISAADAPLAFPEGFDDTQLRASMPQVYDTPLEQGIAETLEIFERALADGRLARPE